MNIRSLFRVLIALCLCAVTQGATFTNEVTGNWKGVLEAGPVKLRIVFKIVKEAHGLVATMDSPDQGGKDIPVDKVSFNEGKLRLDVKLLEGVYEGTLDKGKSKIIGRWAQGAQSFPLVLERTESADFPLELEKLSGADLAANKKAAEKLVGTWDGRLESGGTEIHLRLSIAAKEGRAVGTLDSPDQAVIGIPLARITLKDSAVRFEVPGFAASYEGKLGADDSVLEGNWKAGGGGSTPLKFKKAVPVKR